MHYRRSILYPFFMQPFHDFIIVAYTPVHRDTCVVVDFPKISYLIFLCAFVVLSYNLDVTSEQYFVNE